MKMWGILCLALAGAACVAAEREGVTMSASTTNPPVESARIETAMFGAGCFWCSEAVFQRLDGVISVTSGYAGGRVKNPTYKQVCTGETGHAEVVRVTFDPRKITYTQLLERFWHMHDPTTLNRQGADVGTQYRSAIFYYSEAQKRAAEASKKILAAIAGYREPIVTEIVPAADFYPAEDYHADYYNQNSAAPYCRLIIQPKLKKLGLDNPAAKR